MSKVRSIGIIVEDNSDFLAIRELIKRIAKKDKLTFKKVIGNGCGRIKNKCLAWSKNLNRRGCNMLILVHDLDRKILSDLHFELDVELKTSPISNRLVCIPTEELEAWLMSDPKILKEIFGLKRIPKIGNKPESISSPKERLGEHIKFCSDKKTTFLHTKHNEVIAKQISIEEIDKKCKSFRPFHKFVSEQKYR